MCSTPRGVSGALPILCQRYHDLFSPKPTSAQAPMDRIERTPMPSSPYGRGQHGRHWQESMAQADLRPRL
jgi:hypothetical protein